MHPSRARLAAFRPGAASYRASLASLPPDLATLHARVGGIVLYPVKGFGGVGVERARAERHGLVDPATGLADRGVMIAAVKPGVTEEGEAFDAITVSNRTEATFALTRGRIEDGAIVYEAQGLPELRLDPAALAPRSGPATRVRLYDGGPVIDGTRLDGPLAAWASDLLRAHPRRRRFDPGDLVALAPRDGVRRRVADNHRAGEDVDTHFGDGGHVLVGSRSTLAWMNEAMRAGGAREIDMEVFRPNVILEGLPPNAEDVIGEIEIDGPDGPVAIRFASLCTRCDATRVDIHTGEKPDREPLAFLARERPPRGDDANSTTFAINAVARGAAHGRSFRVGDRARVLGERET